MSLGGGERGREKQQQLIIRKKGKMAARFSVMKAKKGRLLPSKGEEDVFSIKEEAARIHLYPLQNRRATGRRESCGIRGGKRKEGTACFQQRETCRALQGAFLLDPFKGV